MLLCFFLRAEESKRNGAWGYPPAGGTLHYSRPSLGALNLRAEEKDRLGFGGKPPAGSNPAKKKARSARYFNKLSFFQKLDLLCARKSSSKLGSSLAISAGSSH